MALLVTSLRGCVLQRAKSHVPAQVKTKHSTPCRSAVWWLGVSLNTSNHYKKFWGEYPVLPDRFVNPEITSFFVLGPFVINRSIATKYALPTCKLLIWCLDSSDNPKLVVARWRENYLAYSNVNLSYSSHLRTVQHQKPLSTSKIKPPSWTSLWLRLCLLDKP
jgi:hypothetical protein